MYYIKRDKDKKVIALYTQANDFATEVLPLYHPEIIEFLSPPPEEGHLNEAWIVSDLNMARVVEDIVDVLLHKHLLLPADIPEAAWNKIMARRRVRKNLNQYKFNDNS